MEQLVRALLRRIGFKSWLLIATWLVCSYRTGDPNDPNRIQALYNKANRLFHLTNPTDATDSIALITYQQMIALAGHSGAAPDSILFHAYFNSGILLDVRADYPQAIRAYQNAWHIKQRNRQWSDSLLYEVAEHTGSAWYRLNNFDSASYYLLQAEALAYRFPGVPEKERLYNDLAVLYYESGNYLQSRNYSMQGLAISQKNPHQNTAGIVSLEINMAVTSYKLGMYQQAIATYQSICSKKIYTTEIFMNMGLAYKAMGNYRQALHWFRQVNATTVPHVYNELAHTHLLMKQPDSAGKYLNSFRMHQAASHQRDNIYSGMYYLYRGEQLVQQQQFEAALQHLQQAIIIFSGHFTNDDPYTSPNTFTGTFTSYRLFDALLKKGTLFETLYSRQHQEKHLQAALATYTSTMALLRYIEKSYDTDEAKLFLKNNSQQVYQNAVLVCMQLHNLHREAGYAQQAFEIAERSKASVMYSGVTEKGIRKTTGIDPALLKRERNIKYNLARLSIRTDQTHDSIALLALANEKASYEIQLVQLQHAIEQHSGYYQLKYSDSYPRPDSLRPLLSSDQAVISFYAAGNTLNVFVITRSGFQHTRIDSFASIQQATRQWLAALQHTEAGRRFKGEPWGAQLYRQLVKPMQALAGNKTEWIIIPDNILYYLPFESLPAEDAPNAKPLLETNEISYQFSARFITARHKRAPAAAKTFSTLAFAPFAQSGQPFPHPDYSFMQQLPASAKEIAQLPGRSFTGAQATKEQFLQYLQQYPVVHLATHAVADTGNSAASFIAFYPQTKQPAQDALYLEELYGLNMDATQLIIISACETGHGQLVNSEGVLSLTRGFAYAGCASLVNSLWKADDEATAAILHRFHSYLQQGYTKSKALRQAKLDYLHSNALNKSPGYWAHLILTGDPRPLVKPAGWHRWLLVSGGLAAVMLLGVIYFKRRKKSTWFS